MMNAVHHLTKKNVLALSLGALGVVYGDIGTSPLYTLKECFNTQNGIPLTPENILGVISLIFWALFIIITLKYVGIVMRADNKGEGGILALMALALNIPETSARKRYILVTMGIFGAALFYGDSIITPAISVLSAVEGLNIATPVFEPYIIPIALTVLIGLFFVQRKGTTQVGAFFGPIMLVWFATLSVLGLFNILKYPVILQAINPFYAIHFFATYQFAGFLVLGAAVLAVTGGEALYADMGHFGQRPIRLAWLGLVYPALLLNYFGQGALLITHPQSIENPFYFLAPKWGLYPLVILSTLATIIASQAVISGAFSLTRQAVQLGYCPRLPIYHTSNEEIGQIYVPWVNWLLLGAIIVLVLAFKSSSNLAGAYGIAVTGTMVITTILTWIVARHLWKWSRLTSNLLIGILLLVDCAFFGSNLFKLLEGGWFPVLIACGAFTFMSTWKRGREVLFERLTEGMLSVDAFLTSIERHPPVKVSGTAIFLTASQDGVPYALLHNLKHNKVLHERVVFMTIYMEEIPFISEKERIQIETLTQQVIRIKARYGFMEEPNIPVLLESCQDFGIPFNLMETSFFLNRETLIPVMKPEMTRWREKLFVAMSKNAMSATEFFKIPTNRVVELGTQIEF